MGMGGPKRERKDKGCCVLRVGPMRWDPIPSGSNTHTEIPQNFLPCGQIRTFVPQVLTLPVKGRVTPGKLGSVEHLDLHLQGSVEGQRG